jgi:hypothetical protein
MASQVVAPLELLAHVSEVNERSGEGDLTMRAVNAARAPGIPGPRNTQCGNFVHALGDCGPKWLG